MVARIANGPDLLEQGNHKRAPVLHRFTETYMRLQDDGHEGPGCCGRVGTPVGCSNPGRSRSLATSEAPHGFLDLNQCRQVCEVESLTPVDSITAVQCAIGLGIAVDSSFLSGKGVSEELLSLGGIGHRAAIGPNKHLERAPGLGFALGGSGPQALEGLKEPLLVALRYCTRKAVRQAMEVGRLVMAQILAEELSVAGKSKDPASSCQPAPMQLRQARRTEPPFPSPCLEDIMDTCTLTGSIQAAKRRRPSLYLLDECEGAL